MAIKYLQEEGGKSEMGLTKPTNKIVVLGSPLITEFKVELGTNMFPGRLVTAGTHADDIGLCGAAGAPFGWLGYEQAAKDYQPATVDTAYGTNDLAPVLFGGHFVIVASIASGSTSNEGQAVVPAASGEVSTAAAITATVPSGATTVTSTSAQPSMTMAGSLPAGGIIVAICMEGGVAGSADCMVHSLI